MTTPGQAFYNRQIEALETQNLDKILAQYTEDARIVGFDFQVQGTEAIRVHFTHYLENLGSLKLKSTEKFAESADSIFFEATVTVAAGEARVYDVFILEGDKASHHFTGLLGFTPHPAPESASVSG